jgi:hypothetical protein
VNDQLSVFRIGASGALQPVPGSPFPILRGMDGIEITPDGAYLAVAQLGTGISIFRISREDGSAAFLPTYPESGRPGASAGLACNCAGTHLFFAKANYLNRTILGVYNLNNGILNPLPGSPFQFANEINSSVVVLTPDDRYAFVSNQGNNLESASVSAFRIGLGGTPTQVKPFIIRGAFAPASVAMNASDTLLATGGSTGDVALFKVAADGRLTLGATSPFTLPGVSAGIKDVALYPPKTCCPAPMIANLTATPNVQWPANHRMAEVGLNYAVQSTCAITTSLTIDSNEAAEDAWRILDNEHVLLGADRAGNGADRVYTITITARNTAGKTETASVFVRVPHDLGRL